MNKERSCYLDQAVTTGRLQGCGVLWTVDLIEDAYQNGWDQDVCESEDDI